MANKFEGHTPGPWSVTKHQRASLAEASIEVGSLAGRAICDMGDYPNADDAANARLIAAAPDLLRACETMRGALRDLLGDYPEIREDDTCRNCGRDYADVEPPLEDRHCPSDDCPTNIARAALALADEVLGDKS